ncbi:hypothetical protein AAFC00_003336 [Neodothiora populina]|uniref:Uracil permease n=1 Tax=Neodothiora populina TaxID=2781224 RepID=A0ABR3PAR7_9PEZI
MLTEKTKPKVEYWAKRLECPIDEDAGYHNTFWCNRDLIPIPENRRTWTWQGYAGYWVISGVNTTAWTAGSTLLSLGLSVPQAIGCVVGVALISALIAVLAGWPGSRLYLGFTVLSRSSWGMRGGFWPVLNRIMTSIIWLGIQMYWGGQSVKIILNAIIGHSFRDLKNTLPESTNVDTASLICFFIFAVIFLPTLMIPPENLQMPFRITFIMITCSMFGLLGWAIGTAGGPGTLFYTPSTKQGSLLAWNAVYGLQSIVGSQASGCLGQSDWTRYAKTPNAALFGQAIAAPVLIVTTSVCGILITSATETIYGAYVWNPFELLLTIQQHSLSAAARAGTFFAALGFLASQLALCQMLNCISSGMDLAALCPKWINIRRGGYLLSVVSMAICPWNYVTKPSTFITVLSGWSVFLSPMTGIVVSDYFLVRQGKYCVGDLYTGNSESAYWYISGFNLRGFTAWAMGLWPLLPGFIRAIKGTASSANGWDHLYQISYFYGFCVAMLVHWGLHTAFPAKKQKASGPFVLQDHVRMLEGRDLGDDSDFGPEQDRHVDFVVDVESKC